MNLLLALPITAPDNPASLSTAAAWAEALDATLDLGWVETKLEGIEDAEYVPYLRLGQMWQAQFDAHQERADGLMADLPKFVRGTARQLPGEVEQALIDAGKETDLLVLVTEGRTGWSRLSRTSISGRVLRHATGPVLVLHAAHRETPSDGPLVLGVDVEDPPSDALLADAARWARRFGVVLDLAYADRLQHPDALEGQRPPGDWMTKLKTQRLVQLQAVLERVPADVRGAIHYRPAVGGRPVRPLAEVADAVRATALVVGTHGRKGVARMMLGSVAEAVIRHATRPVLVLRFQDDDDAR